MSSIQYYLMASAETIGFATIEVINYDLTGRLTSTRSARLRAHGPFGSGYWPARTPVSHFLTAVILLFQPPIISQ